MNTPGDLRYTPSHEWVRVSGDTARCGITDFAQSSLGDVVYVDLPEVGDDVTAGEACAEVESVKAVSDIYAPVSGEVVAVNEAIDDEPEAVNRDPYGDGWLFEVKLADAGQLEGMLDAQAYAAAQADAG